MTAINSNRAIRGPVTAVPVVAGKGVRLVADTENNRWVVEADETVLWEVSPNVGITSASLSESIANFEQIEVWWAQQQKRTLVQRYFVNGLEQLFCQHGKYEKANGNIYLFFAAWSISGNSASKLYCKYKSSEQWTNNTFSDANELCPCKIVGIHRIASN